MRETIPGRIVGVVELKVGGRVVSIPVHSVAFPNDDGAEPCGGFFASGDRIGIVIRDGAPARDVQAQVNKASEEALRHLSGRYLN